MSDKSQIEKLSFESWWNKKGFNSVLLRVAAWEAWMARAELQQQDPDEWVVQDKVPPRKDIDQICWGSGDWYSDWHKNWSFGKMKHGEYPRFGGQLNVRCRRKDLPPAEIQPRTTEEINAEYHAAQAALKSKNPEPEQWPKYCTPIKKISTCTGKQVAYYRRDDERAGETFHTDGTSFTFAMWDNELAKTRLITEVEAMALLKKPEPQPQKTRVRLWMHYIGGTVICGSRPSDGWQEIHHDSEGFYTEE